MHRHLQAVEPSFLNYEVEGALLWDFTLFITGIFSFFFLPCRWAGQALFGTLTPDIIVLTLLYSIAGVCFSH